MGKSPYTVLLKRPYSKNFDDDFYWAYVWASDEYVAVLKAKVQLYKADQQDFGLDKNQGSKDATYALMKAVGVMKGHVIPILYHFSTGANN